ncbi:Flp pilus assembly protein CpaB [Trujillonella endophytica]|uniref:Pilus assembly protein CpaB n=1 Tax=Trujillonella endophytica TaxID=673521 RepID=A0A1H8VR59_9ACTN|nr:RcpC/CpaB family pilus assembly protein [Trujillella endophytica]SEP17763.1 pilus assembly protein CpaB [Trujillella endophytica]
MRRLLAALAALLLAAVGTVVLIAYVRGADARALEGMESVEVLVVDEPIAAGTPAEDLEALIRTELVPAKSAVAGRVTDLALLAGRVATVDLEPGEQLLTGRFGDPAELRTPGTVPVPEGMQEISVLLEPQRVVGGRLVAGDAVGIYLSLLFEDGTATTHAVQHQVLVTRVQGATTVAEDGADAAAAGGAPQTALMVTLAVVSRDAEQIVFGAEHGTLWLSLEPEGADIGGTQVLTQTNVYGEPVR